METNAYTIDQVLASWKSWTEDVYITSVRTKASIRARVAYANELHAWAEEDEGPGGASARQYHGRAGNSEQRFL